MVFSVSNLQDAYSTFNFPAKIPCKVQRILPLDSCDFSATAYISWACPSFQLNWMYPRSLIIFSWLHLHYLTSHLRKVTLVARGLGHKHVSMASDAHILQASRTLQMCENYRECSEQFWTEYWDACSSADGIHSCQLALHREAFPYFQGPFHRWFIKGPFDLKFNHAI